MLAGTAHPTGLEAGDAYIVKTDARGDTIWTRWLVQEDYDFTYVIAQTEDGGYIVANTFEYFDYQAIRMDENGDTVWTAVWGGQGDDTPYAVCECLDGGFALAGYTSAYLNGPSDACLVKLGMSGVTPSLDVSPMSFSYTLGANDTINDGLLLINGGEGFLFWDISTAHGSNWIMVDSVMHWVKPCNTLIVPISFFSSGMSQGMHADTLLISSNDSLNLTTRIPIELRIYPRGEIFVFPNPAFTSFSVDILTFINLPTWGGAVGIYDISGRLLWQQAFSGDPGVACPFIVSLKDGKRLKQGVYFYLVRDEFGTILKKGKFSVVR